MNENRVQRIALLLFALLMAACGGSGGADSSDIEVIDEVSMTVQVSTTPPSYNSELKFTGGGMSADIAKANAILTAAQLEGGISYATYIVSGTMRRTHTLICGTGSSRIEFTFSTMDYRADPDIPVSVFEASYFSAFGTAIKSYLDNQIGTGSVITNASDIRFTVRTTY